MNVAQILRRYVPQPLAALAAIPAVVVLIEYAAFDPWSMLSLGALRWAGIAVVSSGLMLAAWCGVIFFRVGQTWDYFDPPTQLIIDGPYRHSRHPVYLSGMLILGGEALLFESAGLFVYLGLYALALDRLMIPLVEEPVLKRRFGASYVRYRGMVRRWL